MTMWRAGKRIWRLVLAVLIAPLAPPVVLSPLFLMSTDFSARDLFLVFLLAGYPVVILIGLPVHFVLQYARFTRFMTYLGVSAMIAGVPLLLGAAIQLNSIFINGLPEGGLVGLAGALLGVSVVVMAAFVAGSSAFWMIARPDKTVDPALA